MYKKNNDWQKLFSSMMEESLRHGSFNDVGKVVVKYALKLGFSRAHLFWVPTRDDANNNNLMIGITCAGEGCIPDFPLSPLGTSLYPLNQWFGLNEAEQSRDAIFLRSDQEMKIQEQAEAFGYQWPAGEIAFLPLRGSNSLLGALMLDHGQHKIVLSEHERSLMNFFARQVTIVLEHASSISRERRSVQEMSIISHVGRQVMAMAAEQTNLSELLEEVRQHIDLMMDVSNFALVLVDPESNELDLRILYENGVRCKDLRNVSKWKLKDFCWLDAPTPFSGQ